MRVTAKGYGESVPVDTNKSEKGRTRNRRVEFNVEFLK
jgi:outer membrane protein OmpA-like peptidoglycan-associated protein